MVNFDGGAESVSISSRIAETVIGSQTKFKGTVKTEKPIRIDGYFEGEIETTDVVFVSEEGEINGTVVCREMQLLGKGSGKLTCTELFRVTASGSFEGDVVAADLETVKGSVIKGNLQICK